MQLKDGVLQNDGECTRTIVGKARRMEATSIKIMRKHLMVEK